MTHFSFLVQRHHNLQSTFFLNSTLYNSISPSSCSKLLRTPEIARTVFLVTCTKPNQPFGNTYMLEMAPPKTPDYATMLKKLNKDLTDSTAPPLDKKQKKTKQTFYPTESQLCLLDVCGYKGYNEHLAFDSSSEANQFVYNWKNKTPGGP